MSTDDQAERLFGQLAARFIADPTVITRTGFGSNAGLRVGTKIFAMPVRGELVVKLPKERVDELVASGGDLADEALQFVRSAARRQRRR